MTAKVGHTKGVTCGARLPSGQKGKLVGEHIIAFHWQSQNKAAHLAQGAAVAYQVLKAKGTALPKKEKWFNGTPPSDLPPQLRKANYLADFPPKIKVTCMEIEGKGQKDEEVVCNDNSMNSIMHNPHAKKGQPSVYTMKPDA